MEEEKDIWIFLSHSNKDYDRVKQVRNALEEYGRRPIMFFLKCLDDNAEVWELIKREIDARPRFILCRSENTDDPEGWVQKEFNYIREQNKPYEIVDLNSSDSIQDAVAKLVKRSNVYILYSSDNRELALALKEELNRNAFIAADWEDLERDYYQLPGNTASFSGDQSWLQRMTLESYAKTGYVICLWSKPLTQAQEYEFETAVRASGNDGFVVPVVTDRKASPSGLFFKDCHDSYGVRTMHMEDASQEDKVARIVAEVKRLDIVKNNRFG